jgi:hypothetical protein
MISLDQVIPLKVWHKLPWKISCPSLAQLQRFLSDPNKRAGHESPPQDERALSVVMSKKFNSNLPSGLSVHAFAEFFTELFEYQSSEEHDASNISMTTLLDNSNYTVVAVTAPCMFSSQDLKQLTHCIIVAALYMYDNKHGNYVALLGTTDTGDTSLCTLSKQFSVDQSNSGVLLSNPSIVLPWSWFDILPVADN